VEEVALDGGGGVRGRGWGSMEEMKGGEGTQVSQPCAPGMPSSTTIDAMLMMTCQCQRQSQCDVNETVKVKVNANVTKSHLSKIEQQI
jgi:hypothetical protein